MEKKQKKENVIVIVIVIIIFLLGVFFIEIIRRNTYIISDTIEFNEGFKNKEENPTNLDYDFYNSKSIKEQINIRENSVVLPKIPQTPFTQQSCQKFINEYSCQEGILTEEGLVDCNPQYFRIKNLCQFFLSGDSDAYGNILSEVDNLIIDEVPLIINLPEEDSGQEQIPDNSGEGSNTSSDNNSEESTNDTGGSEDQTSTTISYDVYNNQEAYISGFDIQDGKTIIMVDIISVIPQGLSVYPKDSLIITNPDQEIKSYFFIPSTGLLDKSDGNIKEANVNGLMKFYETLDNDEFGFIKISTSNVGEVLMIYIPYIN